METVIKRALFWTAQVTLISLKFADLVWRFRVWDLWNKMVHSSSQRLKTTLVLTRFLTWAAAEKLGRGCREEFGLKKIHTSHGYKPNLKTGAILLQITPWALWEGDSCMRIAESWDSLLKERIFISIRKGFSHWLQQANYNAIPTK